MTVSVDADDSRRDAGTYYISIYKLRHRSDEPLVGCCSGWSGVSCHRRHWSDVSFHSRHWLDVVDIGQMLAHGSRHWSDAGCCCHIVAMGRMLLPHQMTVAVCQLPQSPLVACCSHVECQLPQSTLVGCCSHWSDVSCHSRHWSDVSCHSRHRPDVVAIG